jgi:hypothetical protein
MSFEVVHVPPFVVERVGVGTSWLGQQVVLVDRAVGEEDLDGVGDLTGVMGDPARGLVPGAGLR